LQDGISIIIGCHVIQASHCADVSYFWSDLHDAIKWAPVAGGWSPSNVNREKKHGIQLSFNGKLSKMWSYDVGYSYIDSNLNGTKVAYYQPNGYRIGLHYNYDHWMANILGRMGSGLDNVYGCHTSHKLHPYRTYHQLWVL